MAKGVFCNNVWAPFERISNIDGAFMCGWHFNRSNEYRMLNGIENRLDYITRYLHLVGGLFFIGSMWFLIARREQKQKILIKYIEKVDLEEKEPVSLHPFIDHSKCIGCGACAKSCPEGEILQIIKNRSVLIKPEKCVGHGECEQSCAFGALTLVFGTKTRGIDIPRVTKDYQTNVPGIYIAGELGGMGLIRNAVVQGQWAVKHAANHLQKSPSPVLDFFIVGAGPGGFGAAAQAKLLKKSYHWIDQNTLGGTIYNYPRQKIVMTQPFILAGLGKIKFKRHQVVKEQLLDKFQSIKDHFALDLSEQEKFISVQGTDHNFVIETSHKTYTAQKLILAMGLRGSPRKIGLPNEQMEKVAYSLCDPEAYQSKNVAIVGAGNSAVEAAQYLAKAHLKNKVTLIVRRDYLSSCNQANRDLAEELVASGHLTIIYEAAVKEIQASYLVISQKEKADVTVDNDFLFLFLGSEMPQKFLMSLGITIEKKFREAVNG